MKLSSHICGNSPSSFHFSLIRGGISAHSSHDPSTGYAFSTLQRWLTAADSGVGPLAMALENLIGSGPHEGNLVMFRL